jgi:hypothetical protein
LTSRTSGTSPGRRISEQPCAKYCDSAIRNFSLKFEVSDVLFQSRNSAFDPANMNVQKP